MYIVKYKEVVSMSVCDRLQGGGDTCRAKILASLEGKCEAVYLINSGGRRVLIKLVMNTTEFDPGVVKLIAMTHFDAYVGGRATVWLEI